MRTYEIYLGDTRRDETIDRYYAQRTKFGQITIWDGTNWSDQYKWDYSTSKDFGSSKAANAFVYKCIREDLMLSPQGGFSRYSAFRVKPKKER